MKCLSFLPLLLPTTKLSRQQQVVVQSSSNRFIWRVKNIRECVFFPTSFVCLQRFFTKWIFLLGRNTFNSLFISNFMDPLVTSVEPKKYVVTYTYVWLWKFNSIRPFFLFNKNWNMKWLGKLSLWCVGLRSCAHFDVVYSCWKYKQQPSRELS